jgi:hypothetical protein
VITSRTLGLCADTVGVQLTGATFAEDVPDGIVLDMPDDVQVQVGDDVDIPVSLTSPATLVGEGITSFSAEISYNPTVFKALSAASTNPDLTITFSETTPGFAVLEVTTTSEITESDELLSISGTTYLGNSRSTLLTVDTVITTQAIIDGQQGELTLVGDCAVETQIVELGTPADVDVVDATPSEIRVNVTTLTDEPTVLTVSDLQGHVRATLPLNVRPGTHIATIPTGNLPAGAYIVNMQHGLYVGTDKFLIVR